MIESLKNQRLEDLAKPEESRTAWIYAGYFFACLGGFLAIFMGWHIWKGTKTLPDGSKVFSYNNSDRKHGKNMFFLGVVIFPIAFMLRIYYEM